MNIKDFDSYTFFPAQHWSHTWERQHELVSRFANLLHNNSINVMSPLGLINHNPFYFDFIKRILNYSRKQETSGWQNPILENMKMIKLIHFPFHDTVSSEINYRLLRSQVKISDNNFFWSTYMNPTLYKLFSSSSFKIIDLAERRSANPFLSDEIKSLERKAVHEADLVIIDNHAAIEDYYDLNPNIFYIPQGVNKDSFNIVEGKDRKYIGYIGNLHFAIDYQFLKELIEMNPNEHFLLIGGILEEKANLVLELDNVTHIKQIPKSELNNYLSQMKLGLIPYLIDERTKGVYPTKLFEYLAAGVPVLSTPLPEVMQYANQSYLRISNEPICLSSLLFDMNGCAEIIEDNTWDARWSNYINEIQTCLES